MRDWWETLAARERVLIVIAGVVSAFVIIVQFGLVPLLDYRDRMQARLTSASTQLERVEKAYMRQRALGTLSTGTVDVTAIDQLKAEITQSARDKGLEISRLQGSGESIGLVINSADPRLVFFWLEDVETRLGARIERLSMEQAGQDRVRVTVDLGGGFGS